MQQQEGLHERQRYRDSYCLISSLSFEENYSEDASCIDSACALARDLRAYTDLVGLIRMVV